MMPVVSPPIAIIPLRRVPVKVCPIGVDSPGDSFSRLPPALPHPPAVIARAIPMSIHARVVLTARHLNGNDFAPQGRREKSALVRDAHAPLPHAAFADGADQASARM